MDVHGHGHVLGRCLGNERSARIAHRRCRYDQARTGTGDLGFDAQRFADDSASAEADGEFAADAEAFAVPTGAPDHGFVEDGGEDAAVGDVGEADVMSRGRVGGADDAGGWIDLEIQVQAVRIVPAAREAAGGVGEVEHTRSLWDHCGNTEGFSGFRLGSAFSPLSPFSGSGRHDRGILAAKRIVVPMPVAAIYEI